MSLSAVAAARRTFDDGTWGSAVAERERARIMLRMSQLVSEQRQSLAELEVRDCGKPIGDALGDIDEVAFMFEYYAGWATKIAGDIPPVGPDAMSLIVKEPVGVCGLIVPWNYPMLMAAQKVAPALATGCTVVLKPAEQTPLTALRMAAIAEQAGLPAGVFNVVTGFGAEAGAPLLTHPGVDKISFTGSKATGTMIQRTCADQLKRVTLELGGKSPNIIFGDADLERAIEGSALGVFGNQGEVCSAGSRVFVHRSVYDDVLQGMTDFASAHDARLRTRPGDHDGPVGVGAAARSCAGLHRLRSCRRAPRWSTAERAPTDPALARRVLRCADDLRGHQRGSSRPRGDLRPGGGGDPVQRRRRGGATCRTTPNTDWRRRSGRGDIGLALRTARAVRAGVVWINDSQPAPSETMWGGYKQSGIGRELGPYALDAYLESKQIYINLS